MGTSKAYVKQATLKRRKRQKKINKMNNLGLKDKSKNALSTRWAQMSKQEQIIEKKKLEIQAKIESQKQAAALAAQAKLTNPPKAEASNIFSNDGSFMNQFKALLEKQKQSEKVEKAKEKPIEEKKTHKSEQKAQDHGRKSFDDDGRSHSERRKEDKGSSRDRRRWNDRGRNRQRSPAPPHDERERSAEIHSFVQNPHPNMPNEQSQSSDDYEQWKSQNAIAQSHNNEQNDDSLDQESFGPPAVSHGSFMGGQGGPMGGQGGPMGGQGGPMGGSKGRIGGPGGLMDGPGGPIRGAGGDLGGAGGIMEGSGSLMNMGGQGGHMGGPMGPMGGHMGPGGPMGGMGPNNPWGPPRMGPGGPMGPGGLGPMGPGGPMGGMGPHNPWGPPRMGPMGPGGPGGMGPGGPVGMGPGGPGSMGPGGPMCPGGPMPPFMGGPPNFPPMPPFMGPNGPNSGPPNMSNSGGPMPPFFGPPFPNMGGPPPPPPPAWKDPSKNNGNMRSNDEDTPKIPSLMNLPISGMSVHNIPPPKPLDTNNIPQPEPMKLQNIPPPMPKEMDHGNIPTPRHNEDMFPPSIRNAAADVARNGDQWENALKAIHSQDQTMWFLHNTNSSEYKSFRELVDKFRREEDFSLDVKPKVRPEDKYEPEFSLEDEDSYDGYKHGGRSGGDSGFNSHNLPYQPTWEDLKREQANSHSDEEESRRERRKRKKSRWSNDTSADVKPTLLPPLMPPGMPPMMPPGMPPMMPPGMSPMFPPMPMGIPPPPVSDAKLVKMDEDGLKLSTVNRNNQALMQYAMTNYGSTNLSAEDWKKCEDNFKLNLLYQDMMKKRQEVERLAAAGKNKYEYDSDEDTAEGTWEHKLRSREMFATERWADELTKQATGKHHIGDFLPPEELKKFMEKYSAVKSGKEPDFSDYKEFKLKEDNLGFKMLQKLGWNEGQGLGADGSGIVNPINKGSQNATLGLGAATADAINPDDDEFDAYRKRMMLAYRFRPNPLNNPRRPYY